MVSFAALGLKDVLCLPSKTTVSSSSSQRHALASTITRWGWGSGWSLTGSLAKASSAVGVVGALSVIGLGMYDYTYGFPTRPIGLHV